MVDRVKKSVTRINDQDAFWKVLVDQVANVWADVDVRFSSLCRAAAA